jgi:glucose/arabinose dehydrogenase
MRHRIAFPSVFVCALAACDDPASPVRPAATESASLKRSGANAQVATTAQVLVTGLEELQGSAVGPGGALFVTAPLTGSIWRVDPNVV